VVTFKYISSINYKVDCENLIIGGNNMPSKLSPEIIRSRVFEKTGMKAINVDLDYKTSMSKVVVICPIHGEFRRRACELMVGRGCPKCSAIARGEQRRYSPHQALNVLKSTHSEKYDFPYIESEYHGSGSRITVVCSHHGEFTSVFSDLRDGSGCPECKRVNVGNVRRLSVDDVKHRLSAKWPTYRFLDIDNYESAVNPISVKCPTHGDFSATYDNLIHGHGCPVCGRLQSSAARCNIPGRPGLADYNRYYDKILVTDSPTRGFDGELLVKCKMCRIIMTPSLDQVINRIAAINQSNMGHFDFYCSDKCKSECTTYRKPPITPSPSDSEHEARVKKARGCQSKDKYVLRQIQRDMYGYNFCEKCGRRIDNPDLHHTIEVAKDPDGAITVAGHMLVCYDPCHKELTAMCR